MSEDTTATDARDATDAVTGVEEGHPAMDRIVSAVLELWPEHVKFADRRFALGDAVAAERVARLILRLVGDELPRFAADYRFICELSLEEELHFRRSGTYRLSTFAEADREVYSNHEFMTRYMNGLLMSQLFWSNHTSVIDTYVRDYLPALSPGYRHLEIGPGHGLLLALVAEDARAATIAAWDVSPASLDATRLSLDRLGVTRAVELARHDLFDTSGDQRFDSIVVSEVLEHMEDPAGALRSLRERLTPQGRIFVNFPLNSPMPDHLYLLRTPDEACALVADAGLVIEHTAYFPMSGYKLARAIKAGLTISCVIVARRG